MQGHHLPQAGDPRRDATPNIDDHHLSFDLSRDFRAEALRTSHSGRVAKLALLAALFGPGTSAATAAEIPAASQSAEQTQDPQPPPGISSGDLKREQGELAKQFKKDRNLENYLKGLWELSTRGEQSQLKTSVKKIYEEIIELAEKSQFRQYADGAHLRLGHVKAGDEWYPDEKSAEQARKKLAAKQESFRKKGLSANQRYPELEGEPETLAAVRESIKGNSALAQILEGEFKRRTNQSASVAIGDHTVIVVQRSPEDAAYLAELGEYVYRRLNFLASGRAEIDVFGPHHAEQPMVGRHTCFLMASDPAYFGAISFLGSGKFQALSSEQLKYMEQFKETSGWTTQGEIANRPCPMHINREPRAVSSVVANGMGHYWLWHAANGAWSETNISTKTPHLRGESALNLLTWLGEGVGIWAALDSIGENGFERTQREKSEYGGYKKDADKRLERDYYSAAYEVARDLGSAGNPRLYSLARSSMREIDGKGLAMSFSIVDYLIRERNGDWRGLLGMLAQTGNNPRGFRVPFIEQFGTDAERRDLKQILEKGDEQRLDALFRKKCEDLEKQWREWALKEYAPAHQNPLLPKAETPFRPLRN